MNGLRISVTFIIVLVLFLLSMFQMPLRGYEKIARVEEWTIYHKTEDSCLTQEEIFYSDSENDYYFYCLESDRYLIKRGFEEYQLVFALENGYITIEELSGIIAFGTTAIMD